MARTSSDHTEEILEYVKQLNDNLILWIKTLQENAENEHKSIRADYGFKFTIVFSVLAFSGATLVGVLGYLLVFYFTHQGGGL